MSRRILLAVLVLASAALATRMWTVEEFDRYYRSYKPEWLPRPESLIYGPRRFNYLRQVRLTCDFVARYQVSDSLSADFGGIIEAEHMPTTIETDNTQEAIWIWSRWYELTGHDDFRDNIRRGWVYVKSHAAYREHGGNPANIWYAIWNCGLGFMAEAEYRHAYADSTFRAYADTCGSFYLANPLQNVSAQDNFVTSQSSGMAYEYAREIGNAALRDTALARGRRVKAWIEASATTRLGTQAWAMCGGTAFWGVVHSVGQEDTVAGKLWIETYADSLPGFYPSGMWNCSHNIWLANAYRACAELGHDTGDWLMHHYLADTLLTRDTDDDGGIPATWTDPNTQDQTWVSTYLDFMGMDVFVTPTFDVDVSVLQFTSPDPHDVYIAGDTIEVSVPVANVGRNIARDLDLSIEAGGMGIGVDIESLPFLATETIVAGPIPLDTPGLYTLNAYTDGDDNPLNDTVHLDLKVYGLRNVSGTLTDSSTGEPVRAWVKGRIRGGTAVWDSCETDSTGAFTFQIIDTNITVSIEPDVPYFARAWDFAIHGDTIINLVTQPAHVLVVNNDTLERYASYYTGTLDTLGVTWCLWKRPSGGLVPYPQLGRLRAKTVIWYSGNTHFGTIPASDRDSLAALAGVNLLITGQNIAEALAGTAFLENTCGCRFDSSGWSGFFAFGNRSDSLGAPVTGTATTGGNGAGNQTSRDVITPLGNSSGFLVYDSVAVRYAATRRQLPSGGKVVFMGFGFEAVNRPSAKPTYFNRMQLMSLILTWFGTPSGIAEQPQAASLKPQAVPTVVRGVLFLPRPPTPDPRPLLLDASGRVVQRLHAGANDLAHLPAGVYFLRSDRSDRSYRSYRLLLVR